MRAGVVLVMAGPVPAIHTVAPARSWRAGVDARDEPGHDGGARSSCAKTPKAGPRAAGWRRRGLGIDRLGDFHRGVYSGLLRPDL